MDRQRRGPCVRGVVVLTPMAIVLITGGSGLIGQALTQRLVREGFEVRWLSRMTGAHGGVARFQWNPENGTIDAGALAGVDHIVHLSGAGIADSRWTDARMRELHLSRSGAARQLLRTVVGSKAAPRSFISASGIGYYGAVTSDHVFKEDDPAGTDAIGRLTRDWEGAADEWASVCRVVKLRTPMVLARQGGALKRLRTVFGLGLGAALGSGRQWMPWVHIDDLVEAYMRAIRQVDMHGAFNVVATDQPMNEDFMRALAKVLKRPFVLPKVPAWALRLVFGELSVILLEGSRADGTRLAAAGMRFKYNDLVPALRDALGVDRQ